MSYLTSDELEALYVQQAAPLVRDPAWPDRSLGAAYDHLIALMAASGEHWESRPAKSWLRESGLHTLGDVKRLLDFISTEARVHALRALIDECAVGTTCH